MLPDIYYYNSTCELAIANGDPNYQPPQLLKSFECELGVLPMYFAKEHDIILVEKAPPSSFFENIVNAGFITPGFLNIEDALQNNGFLNSQKNFLFPWGWSPAVHKKLGLFKGNCSDLFKKSPVSQWSEEQKHIFSKKAAVEILKDVLTQNSKSWLPPISELPEVCTSHESIEKLQRRWGKVVVKSPWSGSGRGLQFLRQGEYNQTNRQVISGFFNQQGYVLAGPWYDKIADLSFHFYTKGGGDVDYCGQASFITDNAGRYQGNYLSPLPEDMSDELKGFLGDKIPELGEMLQEAIKNSMLSTSYYGWMGVDVILYKDERGELKIQPCLEINCRFNMGAMTLKLREHIAEGSFGEWRIDYGKKGSFKDKAKTLSKEYPIVMENGKIKEGFVALTPEWDNGQFGAWMQVENLF
jgi:hypothetical protein